MKRLFFCSLIYAGYLFSNMAPEGLERFPNHYFVETGTHNGSGIRFALRAGFQEIHSIEIDKGRAQRARISFRRYPQVHIWHGDSAHILWTVIEPMDEPITFWLDGHNGSPDLSGDSNTPLMQELEQIKRHQIKTHTIIIDNMHCCKTVLFDWLTKDDIIQKIKEINPNYTITYIDDSDQAEYKNNIMVAYVLE